ncbi:MAG TPA: FKBP-type peptidyl-prolyl cis-trans isomerase [Solirubrobacterales bacterium]|nr:FKBP-type peptidyl-prolyl cis-trans isomerase [Solirubrobacterales bacterium]
MIKAWGAICVFLTLTAIGCGGGSDTSSTISYRPFHFPYSSYGEHNARSPQAFLKPAKNGLVGPELKPVFPDSPPPEFLTWVDLIDSLSVPAFTGDRVTFQYVGYGYESEQKFASSWDEGKPSSFTLGKGEVMLGLERGFRRIEVGDRREIVIPPKLASGGSRMQGAPAGETLVYVVEVLAIERN